MEAAVKANEVKPVGRRPTSCSLERTRVLYQDLFQVSILA